MKARALRLLLPLAALVALSGCARHVVLDPSKVPSRNDDDWDVKHQPGPQGLPPPTEAAPSPRPLPASTN